MPAPSRHLSRRHFLQGAGACIALPVFASLLPRAAWADAAHPDGPAAAPKRLLFMSVPLGFVPNPWVVAASPWYGVSINTGEGWLPETEGAGYQMPAVHAALEPYRKHLSFLSGLSNHRYRGESHFGDDVLLTTCDTFADASKAFTNDISCDQVAAGFAPLGGPQVRYSSLSLGIDPCLGTRTGCLSWAAQGIPISPLKQPRQVFDHLFGRDDVPAAVRLQRLRDKRSVLDVTMDQVTYLDGRLGDEDRRKLDEVTAAVRGVESAIQREMSWIDVPKPKTALARPAESPVPCNSTVHSQLMFQLIHAAFLTDSTRVVTYEMPDYFKEVSSVGKHGLNHGGGPAIRKLAIRNDAEASNQLAAFLALVSDSKDADGTPLINNLLATLGTGCWGMNHYVRNLPVLLVGHGGGTVAQGVARRYPSTTPLANLWLTMLRASGMDLAAFGDSTGVLKDLLA